MPYNPLTFIYKNRKEVYYSCNNILTSLHLLIRKLYLNRSNAKDIILYTYYFSAFGRTPIFLVNDMYLDFI